MACLQALINCDPPVKTKKKDIAKINLRLHQTDERYTIFFNKAMNLFMTITTMFFFISLSFSFLFPRFWFVNNCKFLYLFYVEISCQSSALATFIFCLRNCPPLPCLITLLPYGIYWLPSQIVSFYFFNGCTIHLRSKDIEITKMFVIFAICS